MSFTLNLCSSIFIGIHWIRSSIQRSNSYIISRKTQKVSKGTSVTGASSDVQVCTPPRKFGILQFFYIKPHYYYYYYYYYCYSALGPVWAQTRAQSGDRYGSGTLRPGQVLRGSLPLLSPTYCIKN